MTSPLVAEIDENRRQFEVEWIQAARAHRDALGGLQAFAESYRRLAAFGSLIRDVAIPSMSQDAGSFLFEAHNDALTSHILARHGAWRSSLQSLRSVIEDCLSGLYYADHSIELTLWNDGKFRMGFTDLIRYFEIHPAYAGVDQQRSGIATIKEEYATLSRAVHGSSKNFRMTSVSSEVLLWSDKKSSAAQWVSREKRTLEALAMMICIRYAGAMAGARLPHVRSMMVFVISHRARAFLKNEKNINS